MEQISQRIRSELFELQDADYRTFQSKLMPTVNPERIIGVRTAEVRKLAGKLKTHPQIGDFLRELPHLYYDENNLHAFLVAQIGDYNACVREICRFLPYVDNWATCDMLRPKCFAQHKEELLKEIRVWLASPHPYTVRFGLEMLMLHYLDGVFRPEYLCWASEIVSAAYYVHMMQAWFFAEALVRQYDHAIVYIRERRLPVWVHNKTIQKAIESYRVTGAQKEYLKSLRQK